MHTVWGAWCVIQVGQGLPYQTTQEQCLPARMSRCAHPTWQLSDESGTDGFWEKTSKERALVSVGSAATSILAAATSHLPAPPPHPHSMPHPCTRSEMNAAEEGSQPGFDSAWTHECIHRKYLGPLYTHGPHLLQQSLPEGQTTHSRAKEQDLAQLSGLLTPIGREQDPHLTGWWQPQVERKPYLTLCTDFRCFDANHIAYSGDNSQHTHREDLVPKSSLPPKILDTQSTTGIFLCRNTLKGQNR